MEAPSPTGLFLRPPYDGGGAGKLTIARRRCINAVRARDPGRHLRTGRCGPDLSDPKRGDRDPDRGDCPSRFSRGTSDEAVGAFKA